MTAYGLLIRLLLKDKGDSKIFTIITTFVGGLTLLLFIPFEPLKFQFNLSTILILIFLAALFGLTDLFFIRGRQLEEASRAVIVLQIGSVWSLLGGALFVHEPITINKIVGILFIIFGNALIVWTDKKIHFTKGALYIIIGTFLFTIGSIIDKQLISLFSPAFYKGGLFILEALILFVLIPQSAQRIKKELKIQGKIVLVVGPVLIFALYFMMKAFLSGGEVSRILPVFSLSLVFTVIISILFLGERKNVWQKILAMIIVFIGTYFLSLP